MSAVGGETSWNLNRNPLAVGVLRAIRTEEPGAARLCAVRWAAFRLAAHGEEFPARRWPPGVVDACGHSGPRKLFVQKPRG